MIASAESFAVYWQPASDAAGAGGG